MLHVLLLPLLLLLPPLASGWSRYEQPIRLQSAKDGKAVDWELRVDHLLTMSVERENLGLAVLDYQPANMAWLERDKNQLKGCLDHTTLFSFTNNHSTADWSRHGEAALPDLIQLHGRHQRLWAVNGQIPGPTLILPEGAQVRIRLKNRLLLDSLGLNLHGLRLQGQWFHGGVAPLQQCPLTVRSDLDFHFVAEPAGTHWYHGQFPDGHQSNGLLGPLVVLPADGVPEDRDYVALLQDWPWVGTEERAQSWREGSAQWATGAHGDFDGPSAEGANPDDGVWAILVNQKGWHDRHDIRHRPHRIPWTRFAVGKDEHVRIRLIHGGFSHPMSVHFEGHAMEVVAADGADLKPEKVDALIIFPGERYDVRLHTLGRPTRSLYRMVIGLAEQFLTKSAAIREPIYGLAELDFGLGKEEEGEKVDFLLQKSLAKECAILGCPFSSANSTFKTGDGRKFRCIPADRLEKIGQKAGGNKTEKDVVEKHSIAIDPLAQTVDGFQFRMANASFGPFFLAGAAEKALALADGNCSKCESSPCQCFYHKRFTLGRTVQITFAHSQKPESTADNGNSSMPFPLIDLWRHSFSIHLHGTKFKVIKIGLPQMDSRGMAASNSQLEKCLSAKECNHFGAKVEMNGRELEKDTVLVPFGGYTIIRFRAGNPGWWLAETQQKGQRPITRFAFAIGTEEQMPKPPRGFPSDCGTFDPGADIYKQFVFE